MPPCKRSVPCSVLQPTAKNMLNDSAARSRGKLLESENTFSAGSCSSSPDRPCADDTPSHPVCAGVLRNAIDLAQKLMVCELHWCPPPLGRFGVLASTPGSRAERNADPSECSRRSTSRDTGPCTFTRRGGMRRQIAWRDSGHVASCDLLDGRLANSPWCTRASVFTPLLQDLCCDGGHRDVHSEERHLSQPPSSCAGLSHRIARRIAWHKRQVSGHLPKPRRSGPTFRSTVAGHPELRPPRHEPQADDSWPWSTLPLSSASVPSS